MFVFLKIVGAGVVTFSSLVDARCKAVPGSSDWPTQQEWSALNDTLGGQLIKPTPPAAVCHPEQATYNSAVCPTVETEWSTYSFHRDDPVSSVWDNFNNDTCLPDGQYTCSPLGYPAYVVNATTAEHVAAGVKFAASNNIRLIVKGTGHDYMGRSSAPNSLSIWTRHIQEITFHAVFQPTGCSSAANSSAVTAGAGQALEELYSAADAKNLTIIGGMAGGVGIGGYLTGGGHSALSVSYGMAADNVLELTLVTASGDIIMANECQNTDYFYAFRGGGGSTFGVLLSATIKTIPTPVINLFVLEISSSAGATDNYWDAMTYILSQYPALSNNSISGYPALVPNSPTSITTSTATYSGPFLDHTSPFNDISKLSALLGPIASHITATWPSLAVSNITASFPSFYSSFLVNHDTSTAGGNKVLGSRLLGADTLTDNSTALKEALKGFSGGAAFNAFLLGGKGVANAQPRGGSDAVNPAWRTSLAHIVVDLEWPSQNETARTEAEASMIEKVQFLRDLEPDRGAYINEADINEPDWQTSFWGDNYAKLAQFKKSVDPTDVFWGHPCVGNEGWEEVDDGLCTVSWERL